MMSVLKLIWVGILLSYYFIDFTNATIEIIKGDDGEYIEEYVRDGTEKPLDVGRHPSMFKIGDDWLALPEVFSNLDFGADNSPAADDDHEAQLKLRSTRFWGRVYIEGWPQTIQFFRAHFGAEPPLGKKRFVFAEPRNACEELSNGHLLDQGHILIAHRGVCTFGHKAKLASKYNVSGLVIVNNEPGLEHLPGPDAHDSTISVVSIAQMEGLLLEAVYDEGYTTTTNHDEGFGRLLEGYIIPINCEDSGANCRPTTLIEREATTALADGGILTVTPGNGKNLLEVYKETDLPIEYLLAHFGTKVPSLSTTLLLAMSNPPEACDAITNDVRGKIVLVRRGSCPFVKKSENVQSAGGAVMVVGSLHSYIVRMGVEPRWKGLNTAIPVVMVSKRSYSILLAESFMGGRIAFTEDIRVNGTVWEGLEKLASGMNWPRSSTYIEQRYMQLLDMYKGYPDRLEPLSTGRSKVLSELEGGVKGGEEL